MKLNKIFNNLETYLSSLFVTFECQMAHNSNWLNWQQNYRVIGFFYKLH